MGEKDQLIPEAIWRRLQEFLASGANGEVTLQVKRGEVVDAKFSDWVRGR